MLWGPQMTPAELKDLIRTVPDFPKAGILFRDITTLIGHGPGLAATIDHLAARASAADAQAIAGIEARGFIFGAAVAAKLALPFVPVRKPGKLPAARQSVEYSLEYGESRLDIHEDALGRGTRTLIVDDLLATGGTALAAAKLVEIIGGEVAGLAFAIELTALGGRGRLSGYRVASVITY